MSTGPTLLAVDACAALHLKQLNIESVLDDVIRLEVTLLCTKAIEGEMTAMSLSSRIDAWETAGRWRTARITPAERKQFMNWAGNHRPMPGKRDVELIITSQRESAILFTHDGPSAILAKRRGLTVVDVVDLCGLLNHFGGHSWSALNDLLRPLWGFAWQPADLQTTLEDTLLGRPGWDRLISTLAAWLPSTKPATSEK